MFLGSVKAGGKQKERINFKYDYALISSFSLHGRPGSAVNHSLLPTRLNDSLSVLVLLERAAGVGEQTASAAQSTKPKSSTEDRARAIHTRFRCLIRRIRPASREPDHSLRSLDEPKRRRAFASRCWSVKTLH